MKKVVFGFLVVICVVVAMSPLCFSGGGADEGYTLSLKKLIKEAEENLKKVDAEIKRQEVQKQNLQREIKARRHFEKGNSLYELGKPKEALEEWQKALNLTDHPDMKRHIKESDRKARKQQKALKRQKRKTAGYGLKAIDKKVKTRKQKTPRIKETEKRRGAELDIVKPVKKQKKEAVKPKKQKKTEVSKQPVKKQKTKKVKNEKEKTKIKGVELETKQPKEETEKIKRKPVAAKQTKKRPVVKKKNAEKKPKSVKEETKQGIFFEGGSLFTSDAKEIKSRAKDMKPEIKSQKKKLRPKKTKKAKTKIEKSGPVRGYDLNF